MLSFDVFLDDKEKLGNKSGIGAYYSWIMNSVLFQSTNIANFVRLRKIWKDCKVVSELNVTESFVDL